MHRATARRAMPAARPRRWTKCRWNALAMIFAAFVGCNAEPALLRDIRKERLINDIQRVLLESVAAEKSAVLATSDQESQSLRDKRKATAWRPRSIRCAASCAH